MKKILLLVLSIYLLQGELKSQCNWKNRNVQFATWDSCNSNRPRKSVNGYVSFGNTSCLKYQWKVNNNIVNTTSNVMSYTITQNGTYNICVKVTDTCNKCDTTYCKSVTVSCFPNNCNWKSRDVQFATWDSCKSNRSRKSVNGYVSFGNTSCLKYQWKVNNNIVNTTSNVMSYTITQNGTYNICVKVTDTCNKCDTTYCKSVTVSCFPNNCNWKARITNFNVHDSCPKNYIGGKISYINAVNVKFEWTVNGQSVNSNSSYMSKLVTQNGTYNICVKLTDTVKKCDTTYCKPIKINCVCICSKCIWKARKIELKTFDSCNFIGGYMTQNNNLSNCFKYEWTINSAPVVGKSFQINKKIYANGFYTICVKVIDSCNNCDTMYCKTITVNCYNTSINNTEKIKLKIYPNPANSEINIEGLPEGYKIKLISLEGKEFEFDTSEKIDVRNFTYGTYILRIFDSENNVVQQEKIIVQK